MKPLLAAAAVSVVACLASCERGAPSAAAPPPLTVFAAASTTDVMRQAGTRFEATHGIRVVFSFDASSKLARQIKAGAPADVFLSADEAWMDDVAAAGGIVAGSRRDLLSNDLVLIAPAGREFAVEMSRDFKFVERVPQVRRMAVGDPAHVPAGRYARQGLESLGWWASLERALVPTLDVRAALRLVEIGEADAGIVYATDARASDTVVILAAFPSRSHDPIRYPIAMCRESRAAADFVRFLRSAEMTDVFESAGFRVIPDSAAGAGR